METAAKMTEQFATGRFCLPLRDRRCWSQGRQAWPADITTAVPNVCPSEKPPLPGSTFARFRRHHKANGMEWLITPVRW